jgi:hypothetical protein
MKCKYVTNKEEERNMTEECQPVSKAKYATMEDTAQRPDSKQVDNEQHHPVAKLLCREVHYMVECKDVTGKECKHVLMEDWLECETEVTRRLTDVMTGEVVI